MNINADSPFAIIQKLDSDEFLYLEGQIKLLNYISEIQIPSEDQLKEKTKQYVSLTIIPFHQAHEKGYNVHKGNDKIISLSIEKSYDCSFNDIISSFEYRKIDLQDLSFEISNLQYKNLVRDVINKEIANGEGCNFVVPRNLKGKIRNIDIDQALTIFTSLVQQDYGTYWKFIFYTGDRYFIGSTPERHLEIIDNEVRMNPVSGTLFKKNYFKNKTLFKRDLINFLKDPKETNELFMVLEEELKMMCKITGKGGRVIGPILKEMSKLIHTEYLLNGVYNRKDLSILDILRESLFATTVTGSPLQNAFNIICKYESASRKYYGSSVVLIGTNNKGQEILDSPILIRTLDIHKSGSISIGVGSTLVKDSKPQKELEETFVKSEALLDSIYQSYDIERSRVLSNCMNDDDIYLNLQKRNQRLSKFWFFQQHQSIKVEIFKGQKIIIINNGDDFCYMLAYLLKNMGFSIKIVSYNNFNCEAGTNCYVIGPGPGNPNDIQNSKMQKIQKIIASIQSEKFLAVCLGHQLLCKFKGFKCQRLLYPMQGEKKLVSYFGTQYFLGFYNTFIPVYTKQVINKDDLQFSLSENNTIIALRGKNFISMQFHPESILSEYGYDILKQELSRILM
uniref:anthranilate synthase n=1 Tax=Apophlaea sinclairii TaxID=212746 RepID=A0A1C9CBR0_9FLOR|nr:glutamine amidotransferase [Apophlaea sinclairii]AOM65816.1 glutamine amidotransferase [Apophlaea sinclairii]